MRTARFVWVALCVACATAPRPLPEPMPAPAASPGVPVIAVSLDATERIAVARAKRLELWRERAKNAPGNEHGTEALRQLAWARDTAGVELATNALASRSKAVQSMAARALAEYGRDAAASARGPLLAALPSAHPEAQSDLAWALVDLGEPRVVQSALALLRAGELIKAQRLDGGRAYDARELAKLVGTQTLVNLAGDSNTEIRALVAAGLSEQASAEYVDPLARLVVDPEIEVARLAAPGLATIGSERAEKALLEALRTADTERLVRYLEALRDHGGTQALVLALRATPDSGSDAGWLYQERIFDLLSDGFRGGLYDQSGANALYPLTQRATHADHRIRAARALAEVGDSRAIAVLAEHLRKNMPRVDHDKRYQMRRAGGVDWRYESADMIEKLATIHADRKQALAAQAEDALLFWLRSVPSPEPSGIRALAALGSTKGIPLLRAWAAPKEPLPALDYQDATPDAWNTAPSALRYVGKLKDEASWSSLERALTARPKDFDLNFESRNWFENSVLFGVLLSLAKGAAEGMSEWRDRRGFEPLLASIEDPLNNESTRIEAGFALAWVASDGDFSALVERALRYAKSGETLDQDRAGGYLEALLQRPVPVLATELLPLLSHGTAPYLRHQAARAIAVNGFDERALEILVALLDDPVLMIDAALALLPGGSPEVAAYALERLADKPKALDELADLWSTSFRYWTTEHVERGVLFRWVEAAEALERLRIAGRLHVDPRNLLVRTKQMDPFADDYPHSVSRVVLRYRMWQLARGSDASSRERAVRTLELMREAGALLALSRSGGAVAELARAAHFRLSNPAPELPSAPESKEQL